VLASTHMASHVIISSGPGPAAGRKGQRQAGRWPAGQAKEHNQGRPNHHLAHQAAPAPRSECGTPCCSDRTASYDRCACCTPGTPHRPDCQPHHPAQRPPSLTRNDHGQLSGPSLRLAQRTEATCRWHRQIASLNPQLRLQSPERGCASQRLCLPPLACCRSALGGSQVPMLDACPTDTQVKRPLIRRAWYGVAWWNGWP
jgi:hypothetical protein